MARLYLDHVTKTFGKKGEIEAVKNLTMEVEDKAIVAILGPSGCGKTTLLRMITGLETPTSGKVFLGEEDVTKKTIRERDIGMVFQFPVVYFSMNVYDNIATPLKGRHYSKPEIDKRVKEVAKLLDLESDLEKKPRNVDIASRQKIAIARAISKPRKLYLMDEPLSSLDLKDRIELRADLKRFAKALQQTVVYVTHDQSEAMSIADKIMVMCNGDVQQYDTPQNIFTNPVNKFVGYFVGTPGMNFIDCSCDEKESHHVCLVSSGITCEVPEDVEEKLRGHSSKDVILGIRGEDIQVGKTGQNCLEASVVAKERWGNRNVVTLQAGEYTISAKFSLDTEIIIGQKIWIHMPPEKIRVFDRKTEKCIY